MGEYVRHAIFEVSDCLAIGVEFACSIPLSVEVFIAFESIIAVDGDEELDAVAMRFHHKFVETVEHCVVPC